MSITKLTKKTRKQTVRDLIDQYEFGQEITGDDFDLLVAMTCAPVVRVKHLRNPTYPSDQRYLEAIYHGETEWEPFSWNNAISPPTTRMRTWRAMRAAIRGQVTDFMAQTFCGCELCGADDDLTADHRYPFERIVTHFTEQFGEPLIKDGQNGEGVVLAAPEMWQEYHRKHAQYQVLCRSCNSKKGAKVEE